jgi:osmoprotectant transport system permease protein
MRQRAPRAARALGLAALLLCAGLAGCASESSRMVVGSKRFTESYILGEIVSRAGAGVHRPGLGSTAILLQALEAGAIDVYPEYTGTIAREILKTEQSLDLAQINRRLRPLGLAASFPLGFENSYALGMRREDAERLGIRTISDLRAHRGLKLAFTHEFLGRRDGWAGLRATYRLTQAARGVDHGLAYDALAAGEVDVIDVYTTDAKIDDGRIAVLADDRGFFPSYEAVLMHRLDLPERHPGAFAALSRLQGSLDERAMSRLNARAEIDNVPFAGVAQEFLGSRAARAAPTLAQAVFGGDFWRLLAEHAGLVAGSLAAAVLIGVPLGIGAAKLPALAQPVLAATGLVQTIPSLALLAMLIPLTGSIGLVPALLALFLYALLPIVRNTHAGISQVPRGLSQAGQGLGLSRAQVMGAVELPLALPTILAGVKTSAILNVGTATIAAFIGAGGFGERIAKGLALNDSTTLLAGALPAAALALAVHGMFELAERMLARRPR